MYSLYVRLNAAAYMDRHSRDILKTEFVGGGGLSFSGGAVTLVMTPHCLSDRLL